MTRTCVFDAPTQVRDVCRQIVTDYEARAKLWMSPAQNAERYLRPLVTEFASWMRSNRDVLYQGSATEGLLRSMDEDLRTSLKRQVRGMRPCLVLLGGRLIGRLQLIVDRAASPVAGKQRYTSCRLFEGRSWSVRSVSHPHAFLRLVNNCDESFSVHCWVPNWNIIAYPPLTQIKPQKT